MSFDTNKNWVYQIVGRNIHLWQVGSGGVVDTLGSYKIRLPSGYYGNQLVYPDEDITNGLRFEYTSLDAPFVDEAWESLTAQTGQNDDEAGANTGIAFVDGGGGSDTITDTGSSFLKAGFATGDKIRVIGSASNDGDYLLTAAISGTLTVASGSLTAEDAGESVTIYQVPDEDTDPDETSHVNVNRMLSLAIVSYVKAMNSERLTKVDEYKFYMQDFWKKVGDDDSNKRLITKVLPSSPYAIR